MGRGSFGTRKDGRKYPKMTKINYQERRILQAQIVKEILAGIRDHSLDLAPENRSARRHYLESLIRKGNTEEQRIRKKEVIRSIEGNLKSHFISYLGEGETLKQRQAIEEQEMREDLVFFKHLS